MLAYRTRAAIAAARAWHHWLQVDKAKAEPRLAERLGRSDKVWPKRM